MGKVLYSLHFPAWNISGLVLFAHPNFLNIQNLGQMLLSPGSSRSELFFDSECTQSFSSDYLPIICPAHWGRRTFLVHLFITSSLPSTVVLYMSYAWGLQNLNPSNTFTIWHGITIATGRQDVCLLSQCLAKLEWKNFGEILENPEDQCEFILNDGCP